MSLSRIKLERPLVFFDIESTGTDIVKDRIVELCLIKYMPDASKETKLMRFNPGRPIPAEATAVHGITDADVANEPPFTSKAQEIKDYISDCDLGGYNIQRFDVPMLVEELLRAGVSDPIASDVRFVDSFRIFAMMEKRDLTSALQFYCGKTLEKAHTAEADTIASAEVLNGQVERYGFKGDIASLSELSSDGELLDYDRKFARNDHGQIIFTFGANKGKKVLDNPGMLQWMLDKDFSEHTKYIARKIMKGELK